MPWERRRYRRNKVWVEVDADGKPVLDDRGLGRIRYKNEAGERAYTVRPEEIRPVDAVDAQPSSGPVPAANSLNADSKNPGDAPPPAKGRADSPAEPSASSDDEFEPGDDVPALAGLALHAYTDGASSGNPGPAGIGVVLIWREHRREVSRYLGETTNNVAELTAILDALRLVKRRDLPVRVHADSSYAIGVLSGEMRVKANRDLVATIRSEMRSFADLRLVKVSGHSGVEENERADALARLAVKNRRSL